MRIGISINSTWNICNFRKGLVKELLAEGHSVVAIAPNDEHVAKLKELGCEHIPLKMQNKGKNPFSDLGLVYRLGKIYRAANLDVVLQFTIKPNIYGSLAAGILSMFSWREKLPVINNVTGLGTVFIRNQSLSSKVAKLLYRFSFRYPVKVFFQNADDKKVFLNESLVPSKLVDVLPGSGINLKEFTPRPLVKNERFTFLMISRLLVDKGVREFAEAIRMMRKAGSQARFLLVGPMDLTSGLGVSEQEVADWEKEGLLEYLGRTDDVRPLIESADCVVLPSYREGTPRTLIEAASMARPIVTTDVPGCRETVEEGYNGFMCRVKDAKDLAQKMTRMAQLETQTLTEMGANSRELAERKFDERIVINKYLEVISQFDKHAYDRQTESVPYPVAFMRSRLSYQRQSD